MNKTVTINISGIIFHIEEDAYDKLSKYLSTIKGYFTNADGGSEIMSDIEARIAEMLQGKTSAVKQVVLMSDVDYVMDSMGKPEEFAGDTEQNGAGNYSDSNDEEWSGKSVKKRLFRDPDHKVIGGVCSGIAAYFDIDVIWIRIAMALLTFAAGMSIWVYLVLWIVMPLAKTTADKLAMRGEKVDINNISKAVKEEAEFFKKRMQKYGKDFSEFTTNNRDLPRNAIEKTVDFFTDILINIGRVLLKILGVAMVIIGVLIFFTMFGASFGLNSFNTGNIDLQEWIDMLLTDGKDFYIGLIGILIFVGIPVLMLIYGGLKIVFKLKHHNRWINLSASVVWLVGFCLVLYVGIRTGQDFNKTVKVRENIPVKQYDNLVLKMTEAAIDYDEFQERNFSESRRHHDDYILGTKNDKKFLLGYGQLNIIKSQTNNIELVIVKEARGATRQIAKHRAEHITYSVSQNDSLLNFDDMFKVIDADKFRRQDITVLLKLPVGKTVYLDQSLENLIYDIENVTDTYDGDMINRRWKMTENGLVCVDCEGISSKKQHTSDDDDDDVKINVNGVNINAKDADIKMDSNGVNINSPDAKVIINKKGIHVSSKN